MSGVAGITSRVAGIAPLVLAAVAAAPASQYLATFQDANVEKATSLARAIPKDALVFVQSTRLDALRTDFLASAWFDFYQDEELEELRESITQLIGIPGKTFEAREGHSLHSALGVDPWEVLGSLHGSIACFAASEAGQSEPVGGVLFVPGEDRGKFEELFAKLEESEGTTRVRSTSEYAGVELTLFEAPAKSKSDDSDEESKRRYSTYFDAGEWAGMLSAASREELLELVHGMIDRMSGKDPASGLEANEALTSARATVSAPGRIEVFVDLTKVLAMVKKADSHDERIEGVRQALAIDDLRWVYATADVGQGEKLRAELVLRLPESGYLREWFGFLAPYPREMAALAPRSCTSISLAQFDVWGMWQSVWGMMAELEPESTEQARDRMTSMLQQLGGLDVEKSFVSQLDGRFLNFNIPVPPDEASLSWSAQFQAGLRNRVNVEVPDPISPTGNATVLGLRDTSVVSSFVQGLLTAVGVYQQVETEEFQGTTIHKLADGPTGLEWAFTKNAAVVSQYPTAFRAALRMQGAEAKDSALEVEGFKPLYAAYADSAVLGLANTADALKSGVNVLEMLGLFYVMGSMRHQAEAGGEGDPNPFEHLPTSASIERHFKGTLVTSLTRASGVVHLQVSTR